MEESIERIYGLKKNFSILALTGLEGSGCSYLAEIMSKESRDVILDAKRLRKPVTFTLTHPAKTINNDELYKSGATNNETIGQLVFHRKYSICYNFYKERYIPYTIIKYSKVCWFFALLNLKETISDGREFSNDYLKEQCFEIFKDKYISSKYDPDFDKDYCSKHPNLSDDEIKALVEKFKYGNLAQEIINNYCDDYTDATGDDAKKLAEIFFDEKSSFSQWYQSVTDVLTQKDYYRTCFFYHRFASVIRTCGNPMSTIEEAKKAKTYEHVFCIINLANRLIKGKGERGDQRRFVIDSIRNSTELSYMKERYNAFYVIAVGSDDDQRNKFIEKKLNILDDKDRELTRLAIRRITDYEADRKEYEEGHLSFPNTELCIADAEIHITNLDKDPDATDYSFSSIEEQWMKYASLILHPGLIAPSPEERCMAVAYTARLNSSCVSRQVGAVITNQYHAIRTIGWNDVPFGQVPCGLRDLRDHIKKSYDTEDEMMYSEFERSMEVQRYENKCFRDCIRKDFGTIDFNDEAIKGLAAPYCFRTLDNKYTGDVNQTQTRSLHAEENAMMQMVKYGGEPLMNGIIYVTDSPCELCSKKLYQIGVRRIVYIDSYPGIANDNITHNGLKQPELVRYKGAYGSSYIKLYRPVISQKDEFAIRTKHQHTIDPPKKLLKDILEKLDVPMQKHFDSNQIQDILSMVPDKRKKKN